MPHLQCGFDNRTFLSLGEVLQTTTAASLLASLPLNAKLVNGYGPAECTLCSTTHVVTESNIQNGVIPIGWSDSAHECLVCDEHLVPVSPGNIGELFVGGLSYEVGKRDRRQTLPSRHLLGKNDAHVLTRH